MPGILEQARHDSQAVRGRQGLQPQPLGQCSSALPSASLSSNPRLLSISFRLAILDTPPPKGQCSSSSSSPKNQEATGVDPSDTSPLPSVGKNELETVPI
jgi:hypothetical protein